MRLGITPLGQCLTILRVASWIVPGRARSEWLKEWEAELVFAWQTSQARSGQLTLSQLRRRCWGAFVDAAWHRCNRDHLRTTGEHWFQTPTFVLVALSGPVILRLRRSPVFSAALDGVVAGSLALMAVVTWQLGKASLVDWQTLTIFAVSLIALLRFKVNSAWLIVGAGIVGALLR